ncbi:MAG: hypothetical protein NZ900_09030 [Synergistetes bacterium]|nr:hypothetical protein [Synergistota bacterium]MDW8193060.1 hypothetical protein [Synergistota bacterium]
MAIRPIDMQVLVGKLYEVGRVQHQEDQASLVSHQAFASEFRERTEKERVQVQATYRGEGQKVEEERRGSGSGYTPSRRKRPQSNLFVSGVKDPVKGKFIDITS